MSGEGVVPWHQVSSICRCFGYNPLEGQVRVLLAGGNEDEPATKEDLETKMIHFDDFLPILWAIENCNAPGTYEDFYEGLKVYLTVMTTVLLYC